jgi:hypothetical protein
MAKLKRHTIKRRCKPPFYWWANDRFNRLVIQMDATNPRDGHISWCFASPVDIRRGEYLEINGIALEGSAARQLIQAIKELMDEDETY